MPIITEQTPTTLLVWWNGGPTGADIDEVIRLLGDRMETGRKLHYICVVSHLASPPTPDGRSAFIERADHVLELARTFQLVLAANPFVNSIARGLIATSGVQRRYRDRFLLHQHLDQAVMNVFESTRDEQLLRIESPEGA